MAESVKDQTSVSGKGKTQHLVCFYSTSGPVQGQFTYTIHSYECSVFGHKTLSHQELSLIVVENSE